MFADSNIAENSEEIKTVFQNSQGKKTIDIYWIADDGGEPKQELMKYTQYSGPGHAGHMCLGTPWCPSR